jgi:two-component system response regulator YesN
MNIVIADDEQLARETLLSILSEICPDVHLYEARNGQELIDLVERVQPEAAFVDIRMPGKTGLEAIQESIPLAPNTQWIIVTGFSDFTYAKEALRLRAIDYLLKPVDTDDVQQLLTKIQQTAQRQIIDHNKQFESEMQSLFHGLIHRWDEGEPVNQRSCLFQCQIVYMDSCYSETEKSVSSKPFYQTVRFALPRYYHKDLKLATLLLPSGDWAVVGGWTSLEGAEQLQRFFSFHAELMKQVEEPSLAYTLLVSDECDSYSSLLKEVTELHIKSYLRCVLGISSVWSKADLSRVEAQPMNSKLSHTLIKIVDEYNRWHYVGYMNTIEQFTKIYSEYDRIPPVTSQVISRFLNCSINTPLLTPAKEEEWFQSLKNSGQKLLDNKLTQEGSKPDLVNRTIAYIENHYDGQLTIGHIAEEFNVTPNHLSSLFHKRTGTTFVQYVTRLRMLKAKELLADPRVQVQQAAERVGYFSSRHFTKLFKEFFGCSPSEYKINIHAKDKPNA